MTMNNTIRFMFQTLSVLAILTELIVDLAVSVIAFVIVVSEYAYEIAQIVYSDRHNILAKVNQTRNDLGSYFVYAAWLTRMCANSIGGTNIYHSVQNRVL